MNWEDVIGQNQNLVKQFAVGDLSATKFYNAFKGTDLGGEVRTLLRRRGHVYARRLARKALSRRNISL